MRFFKMHGIGNDYIFFDLINYKTEYNIAELVNKITDRNFGIGGDGLVLIKHSEKYDCTMQMFNADGSEGAMCGNAIRCIGRYIYENIEKKDIYEVETPSGVKRLEILKKEDNDFQVCVNMGKAKISECVNHDNSPFKDISVNKIDIRCVPVEIGNPHCVIFGDSLRMRDFQDLASQIEMSGPWKDGVNVEYVNIISPKKINVEVWERGSGFTLACGTGACASFYACHVRGLCENEVTVLLKGGFLKVKLSETGEIFMTGKAQESFRGEIDLEKYNEKRRLI